MSAKRPHQAFLLLKDSSSNLDISYPLSVKDSGKAKIDLVRGQDMVRMWTQFDRAQTQKELPTQFLNGQSKVSASLVLASFGSSTGYNSEVFTLNVISDKSASANTAEKPLRYGKLPEIHHIFRADQKSPNVLISTVFTLGAIAALPILLGTVSHASTGAKTSTDETSGCSWVETLTTFPKPCQMRRLLMLCLWVQSLALKAFCSCTTPPGTSSRHSQRFSPLA